jgi:hypothetical protein
MLLSEQSTACKLNSHRRSLLSEFFGPNLQRQSKSEMLPRMLAMSHSKAALLPSVVLLVQLLV